MQLYAGFRLFAFRAFLWRWCLEIAPTPNTGIILQLPENQQISINSEGAEPWGH